MRNIGKNFDISKLFIKFAVEYVKCLTLSRIRNMNKLEVLKLGLNQVINNIDSGNSNASDEEIDVILDTINKTTNTQNKLSKYQACKYLNISRATFDNWVRDGKIPEGRKEQGFKEKFWIKSDLDKVKE